MKLVTILAVGVYLFCAPCYANAIGRSHYIFDKPVAGVFPIAQTQTAARIYVDSADWPGIARAAGDLKTDIRRVTELSGPGGKLPYRLLNTMLTPVF
jgi:hypothetical protein